MQGQGEVPLHWELKLQRENWGQGNISKRREDNKDVQFKHLSKSQRKITVA